MKIVAVLLKDMKRYEYFEVDEWQMEKGVLTLMRYDLPGTVAAFPFENLLGITDITSNAALTDEESWRKDESN